MARQNNLIGKKGFHIVHQNMNSIRTKDHLIDNYFNNKNFHVITMSETWLDERDITSKYDLKGYNLIRWDRQWGQRPTNPELPKVGGGMGTYLKGDLDFSDREFSNLNLSCNDIEAQVIRIYNKGIERDLRCHNE